MRRNISAILLLIVFLTLQFGKVATYLYCKWEAEIVQNKPDCGCDKHLADMFQHHNDGDSKNDLSKNTVNEKLNEFTPKSMIAILPVYISFSKCFTEYNSSLSERFPDSLFHPPMA